MLKQVVLVILAFSVASQQTLALSVCPCSLAAKEACADAPLEPSPAEAEDSCHETAPAVEAQSCCHDADDSCAPDSATWIDISQPEECCQYLVTLPERLSSYSGDLAFQPEFQPTTWLDLGSLVFSEQRILNHAGQWRVQSDQQRYLQLSILLN